MSSRVFALLSVLLFLSSSAFADIRKFCTTQDLSEAVTITLSVGALNVSDVNRTMNGAYFPPRSVDDSMRTVAGNSYFIFEGPIGKTLVTFFVSQSMMNNSEASGSMVVIGGTRRIDFRCRPSR